MDKRKLLIICFLFSIVILPGIVFAKLVLPELGSSYVVDGQKTKVVGVGNRPFEYMSKGESLILICLDDPSYKLVIVQDAGVRVKVDPAKPSLLVGKEEKLDNIWKKGTYLLVEYDRLGN